MGRPYRGQNLDRNNCWPPVYNRDIAHPNSEYWRSEAYLAMHGFDKLPLSQDEWARFQGYFEAWLSDGRTWKECYNVYSIAAKSYSPGMEIAELAYRVGILPDECQCVLPEQSCKYCRIAARVASEVEK